MRLIISIFFVFFVSSAFAQPIPGLFNRNDLNDDLINAEAGVLDFLIRFFLGGSRSRGGESGIDLIQLGANVLRALGNTENNQEESEIGSRNELFQDPRVLSFGEEIGRRNTIQRNLRITPNQLAGLSRLFSGFINILN